MREAERGDRRSYPFRLAFIESAWLAGTHVAEGASACAGVAHDHHGGVALAPALADIGTGGLLAYRMEPMCAQCHACRDCRV